MSSFLFWVSGRQIIQEEEILTIKVKPGWKKGTKITFEGMGNERPGSCPADIIFVIAEKRHSLFRREGEDLEIGVEIPLVKALTGCQISIPLLGGKKTSLLIDDIIYPGYERIIEGQGMPNTKEQGKRGSLTVVVLVEFPTELTDEQRSDILSILQDSS
jgi:DnaJ family protein B protein 13